MPADLATDTMDLVVLGGGVMGLFTAYEASARFGRVTVLEAGTIGDPLTASFGRTRSYRKDYLDPVYVRLAEEAVGRWDQFERDTGQSVLVRCGCLNMATSAVTPDLDDTYAELSARTLTRLGLPLTTFGPAGVRANYPYLTADRAYLDETAGLVDVQAATAALRRTLDERKVVMYEHVQTHSITPEGDLVRIRTDSGDWLTRALVITAGHGTNDLLTRLAGCDLQFPISKDRPSEAKYVTPPLAVRQQFTSDVMPVIAYLDTGVYLHPIVEGVVDAVKIGYFNPPDLPRGRTGVQNIEGFVAQCLPGLVGAEFVDVLDVDQCDYDMVADDDFILGALPGFPNIFVGVGWRGTGYKFAPWVGHVLFQLSCQAGSVYDITRFDPARFHVERPS